MTVFPIGPRTKWILQGLVGGLLCWLGIELIVADLFRDDEPRTTIAREIESANPPTPSQSAPVPTDPNSAAESSTRQSAPRRRMGLVLDEERHPVADAQVSLYTGAPALLNEGSQPFARVDVDTEGRFEIPNDPVVSVLGVEGPGYEEQTYTLRGDEEPTLILSRRTREIVIAGSVRSVVGEPIRAFELLAGTSSQQLCDWTPFQDYTGKFELRLAVPRDSAIEVRISARSHGFAEKTVDPIAFGASDLATTPIEITLEKGTPVFGFVRDVAERPIAGARAQFFYEHGAYGPSCRSGTDGILEATLDPKRQTTALWVTAKEYGDTEVRPSDVGGTWEGFIVRMDSGVLLSGSVRSAGGVPVADAIVLVWSESAAALEVMSSPKWTRSLMTAKDGSFRLPHSPRRTLFAMAYHEVDDSIEPISSAVTIDAPQGDYVEVIIETGGRLRVEGRVEIPAIPHAAISIQWRANADDSAAQEERILASWSGAVGEKFVLLGPPLAERPAKSWLRIHLSDDAYVERPLLITSDITTLEPFEFSPKDLREFDRSQATSPTKR